MLPWETAGLVVTRTAGRAELHATLLWREGEKPETSMLTEFAPGEDFTGYMRETEDPTSGTRTLEGEVRALDEACLARALEETLRSITRVAALTGSVLEARAVRTDSPRIAETHAVQSVALGMRAEGFPARFGRSWSIATGPEVDVCLGTGGDPELERFVQEHPAWRCAKDVL